MDIRGAYHTDSGMPRSHSDLCTFMVGSARKHFRLYLGSLHDDRYPSQFTTNRPRFTHICLRECCNVYRAAGLLSLLLNQSHILSLLGCVVLSTCAHLWRLHGCIYLFFSLRRSFFRNSCIFWS